MGRCAEHIFCGFFTSFQTF